MKIDTEEINFEVAFETQNEIEEFFDWIIENQATIETWSMYIAKRTKSGTVKFTDHDAAMAFKLRWF